MRIDLPQCNFKLCRKCFDGNCVGSENDKIDCNEFKNGGWIPVSERLPNEEECEKFDIGHPNSRKFLCTIKIGDYEPQIRELYFSKLFGWKYGPEDYNEHVIAWQPLPESYKEGSNE